MAFNHLVGGRGSNQAGSYQPIQIVTPPYPVGLPPNYGIKSPGVAGVGEAPATDATHRILNASTSTLPTGWSEARASSATYYNSSGVVSTASSNTLRNDYTSGGVLRGYLIEPASSNIAKWSGGINTANSPWTADPSQSITSTTIADPAGGTSASTISISGTTGGAIYQLQQPVTLGAIYTVSAWVKQSASGSSTHVRLTTNNAAAFNSGVSAKFALTSTWTRVSVTGVISTVNGGLGAVCNFGFDNRDETGTRDSNVSGNIDVWGMQCEPGSLLTSYIATTTASVSRPADVATFTIDSAATDLALTYDDGSVTVYTGVPSGSTFNVPTSNTLRLLYIDDNVAAGNIGAASGTGSATAEGTGIFAAVGSASGAGAATAGVVALNINDKYTDITLSGGDLTATATNTPGFNFNVRGNTAGVAGRYFEFVFTTINTGTAGAGIGLANLTQSLSAYPGDPNGIGWFFSGYVEWPGSGFSNNFGSFAVNDVLGLLLEASDVKLYKNGTLVGTATTLPSGSLYPVVSLANSGDVGTINFGSKAFSFLPSGATGWNGLTPAAGSVGSASGTGTGSGVGASTAAGVGSAAGTGAATAVGASTARSSGSASGSGAATAVGASTAASVGSAAGSGAATAVGASTARSVGSAAGSGAATATAGLVGAAAGSGAATAVGASTAASAGSSAGSGAATAVGASTAASVGSSAGSGSATAASVSSAVGSAAGTGSASAVGKATATAVGSVTGSGSATAVGSATAAGTGASSGSGAATAIGAATAAGVGSSSGTATASAFTGIVAQASGSGTATAVGASTAAAIGASAGTGTATAASSSTSISSAVGASSGTGTATATGTGIQSAVGSSAGSGTASGVGTTVAVTTVVSAIGIAAGSSTSIAFAPSVDFSDDFGDDFATLLITLPEQNDFGPDFNFDFAVLHESSFNDDFNDDFAVRHITQDFNEDFSSDFAVHHIAQRIVSGVGRAGGASIVSGPILGIIPGGVPGDGEPPTEPPVFPPRPPPVPIVWHPAIEYRRVQAPRAIRIHRRGTELRKATPRSMKRRYG